MKSIRDANLTSAAQVYAISNTPIFLMRRLQEDPTIFDLSRFPGEQIAEEFRLAIAKPPSTLLDFVKPYAFLAALSKLPTIEFLKKIDVENVEHWRWLAYAKQILLTTYSPPISMTSLHGKKASMSASSLFDVSSTNSKTKIEIG